MRRKILFALIAVALVLGVGLTPRTAQAATFCKDGLVKKIVWSQNEWHYLVGIRPAQGVTDGSKYWVQFAPLPTGAAVSWDGTYMWFGYRYPSNWQDPFSASSWRFCVNI
ncbi:hypothetical protein BH09PAT2_BH09PAT2_04510 [soil metagenome]